VDRRLSALTTLVVLAASPLAQADEGTEVEPISVRYSPPPECPRENTFARQVLARTHRGRLAQPGEAARDFEVVVQVQGPRRVSGTLRVRDMAGATTTRTVRGKGCVEVEAALALIAALIVDPEASTRPVATLVLPAIDVPVPPPPDVPPVPPFPPPRPPPTITPPPPPPPAPRALQGPRLAAELAGVARTGIAGEPAFGGSAALTVEARSRGLLSPEGRVSVSVAQGLDVSTSAGQASFRWLTGSLEGCALRVGSSELYARLCAVLEGGGLFAVGSDTPDPQSTVRPWLAAGGAVRGKWHMAGPVSLVAEVGVIAPFLRDSFGFGPRGGQFQVTLPEVPPVILAGSLGIALSGR
jgi:hypothetical protein